MFINNVCTMIRIAVTKQLYMQLMMHSWCRLVGLLIHENNFCGHRSSLKRTACRRSFPGLAACTPVKSAFWLRRRITPMQKILPAAGERKNFDRPMPRAMIFVYLHSRWTPTDINLYRRWLTTVNINPDTFTGALS